MKITIRTKRASILACFSLLLTVPCVRANGSVAGISILNKSLAKYSALKSYTAVIKASTVLQPVNGDKANTIDSTINVSYKKPNFVHAEIQGLMGGGTLVSDGQNTYFYSALSNTYSVKPSKANLFSLVTGSVSRATALSYVGPSSIDGKKMIELKGSYTSDHGNELVTIYIDAESYLLRRTEAHIPRLPGPQGGSYRMTITTDYLSQKTNPIVAVSQFHFVPPPDAQKDVSGNLPSISGSQGGF